MVLEFHSDHKVSSGLGRKRRAGSCASPARPPGRPANLQARELVVAAIKSSGVIRFGDLRRATGLSRGSLSRILRELERSASVQRIIKQVTFELVAYRLSSSSFDGYGTFPEPSKIVYKSPITQKINR